ncbi:MAG: DUF2281 domain-containing protein [Candidatus Methylumidiphilus sp.]
MTVTEKLHEEIKQLPEPLLNEVLDFVRFIRLHQDNLPTYEKPKKSGKDLYLHMTETGLIDSLDAEENLSECYKQHLWK